MVSRTSLCLIATGAHEADDNAFTYGLLHAIEARRAAELEHRYPNVLSDPPNEDLDVWLR